MTASVQAAAPSRAGNPWSRLYRGENSFDFVGRKRLWLVISAAVILAGLISLGTRGLNLGIDFVGGTSWQVPTSTMTLNQAQSALASQGIGSATIETLGSGASRTLEVQYNLGTASTAVKTAKEQAVATKLASVARVSPSAVSINDVGPTWGSDITSKAVRALIVFLVVVALYIALRFEWRMAVAALVALLHDILVTVGIYSLSGFQVTPATVVAVLTILGYSLYDTVVVFDKVQENTKGVGATGRLTISDTINLSMNQVLARSVNTSLMAILPILSVLVIGAEVLGATTLQDFGLALTIGLLSGAYSSIFIASPLLAVLKEHEPRYANIRRRLTARGEPAAVLVPAAASAGTGRGRPVPEAAVNGVASEPPPAGRPARPPPARGSPRPVARRPPPRPRKKGKRR